MTPISQRLMVFFLVTAVGAPLLAADSNAPASSVPVALSAPAVTVGMRVGEVPSTYDDGGRRDPFVSLVAPKRVLSPTADAGRPRTGLAAVALADIAVRGVVKSGKTMVAILEAPDRQSFVARPKDRLLDASVQSIDGAGVVFVQSESGGPPQQVRKALHSAAEEVQ